MINYILASILVSSIFCSGASVTESDVDKAYVYFSKNLNEFGILTQAERVSNYCKGDAWYKDVSTPGFTRIRWKESEKNFRIPDSPELLYKTNKEFLVRLSISDCFCKTENEVCLYNINSNSCYIFNVMLDNGEREAQIKSYREGVSTLIVEDWIHTSILTYRITTQTVPM